MTGERDARSDGAAGADPELPDAAQEARDATWPSAEAPLKLPRGAEAAATVAAELESAAPNSRRRAAGLERSFGGGRFALSSHLGAGAMGVVYEAHDGHKNERVALKTLQNLDASSIQRLKAEFRSLANVMHPNLVRLREFFSDADEVFFTMDLIEGVGLAAFVESERSGAAGESDEIGPRGRDFVVLRNVFRQLAEGLHALHAHGKVHRDLKPSNVMVRNDGRVVVLDFGVTVDVGGSKAVIDKPAIAGTPAYMAPEQVLGSAPSPASDWYAFGTVLFEALTGRLPFEGALFEMLNAKTEGRAIALDDPDVPPDLRALAVELLAPSPESRPRGSEVRARLGGDHGGEQESRRPLSSGGRRAEFVGRDTELGALEVALHRTLQGELVTVVVSGASGIGKTTLVQEFLNDDCVAKGALVLESKCFEQEFVRYNALDGVIDGLRAHMRRLSPALRARLTPRHAGALAAIFPSLGDVLARDTPGGERLPAQPGERRRMAFLALRELLGRMSELSPLVLFLDDLQWGDQDSARLLAVLLGGNDPPPMLVIASCRSDERAASPVLRGLESEGKTVWDPIEVEVLPLSDADAEHLLGRVLSDDRRALAPAIIAEARGNPFFLLEMALAVEEAGPGASALPLADVIGSRLKSLPEPARALLERVAIAERPIAWRLIEKALPDPSEVDLGWLALRRGKLVRSVGVAGEAQVQCYHDRIRETVAAGLAPERTRALHEELAVALEAEPTPDPEQLAEHFRRCGRIDKAFYYARRAGDEARAGLAFGRAARWFELALELSSADEPGRRTLLVELGEVLENAGHAVLAAERYLAAARLSADAHEALDLRRRAAGQLLGSGRVKEGLEVLESVLAAVGEKSPASIAGAVTSLIWDRMALRLRGLEFGERPVAAIDRKDLLRIDALAVAAAGYTRCDFLRGAVFACKELRLALAAGETTRIARALGSELLFVANEGVSQAKKVAALRELALGLLEKVDDERVRGYLKGCCGSAHMLLGDARSATPELAEAEALLARGRPSWELTFTRGMWGLSLQIQGAMVEAGEAYSEWLSDARERADLQAERYFAVNHSFSDLALDRAEAAHENLVEALRATEGTGNDYLHYAGLHAFVLIASYRHEGPDVFTRYAKEHEPFFRSTLRGGQVSRSYVNVYLGYCAAVVAAYTPPERRELGVLRRMVRRLLVEKAPFAEAHARLLSAAAHRLENRPSEAAAELRRGAEIFDSLGQALQAGAARYQLGRLLGGDAGLLLVDEALAAGEALRVKNPARMYEAYTPGFWP